MYTRALHRPQLVIVPNASAAESLGVFLPTATDTEFAVSEAAEAQGLGCVRGARYAIAIEVFAVFALYGGWRFLHFIHVF